MNNPWLKKNPFLSMWLSGANRITQSARSQLAAEAKRQFDQTLVQVTQDHAKRWFGTPAATRPKPKAKARRR